MAEGKVTVCDDDVVVGSWQQAFGASAFLIGAFCERNCEYRVNE